MKLFKVGKSIQLSEHFADDVKKAEEAGFDSIDYDLCLYWKNREKEIELYQKIEEGLEIIKGSRLYFNCVHVSFGPFWDFSALDEQARKQAVARTKEIFSRCDAYHPFGYVLHGSFEPISAEERPRHIEQLKKSLCELRAYTSAKICVETLPRSCLCNTSDETIEIVDAVPGIDVCVDVNHLLREKSEDCVRKLGKRIQTTHISDFDYINERHWMPGEGKIDWKALLQAFQESGYHGVWNYELNLDCPETILRPRDFTYEDFIRNAEEIFNGKQITVIGQPKENLEF